MKKKWLKIFCMALFAVALASCGSSSTTSSDDGTGGGSGGGESGGGTETPAVEVTSNDEALANIPSSDPTGMDYALSTTASSVNSSFKGLSYQKAYGDDDGGGSYGGDSTIKIKVQAIGDYSFKMFQCVGSTQMGYASYSYDAISNTFSGDILFRYGTDWQADIVSRSKDLLITDANFTGSISVYDSTSALILGASGATGVNTMRGLKDRSGTTFDLGCQWNSSLGCADYTFGDAAGTVPFGITVTASNRDKEGAESSDETQCSNLPAAASLRQISALSGEEVWDCSVPAGETEHTISWTASQLEDAGGEHCASSLSDAWEDSSKANPSACFTEGDTNLTAAQTSCLCNSLYANGAQTVRMMERMFLCKIKGVFALAEQTADADLTLDDGQTIYLSISSIGR